MKQVSKLIKNIFKYPILLIFIIICVFMLPPAINLTSIAFRSAIAVALGIDLNEQDLVELSVAINISSASDSLSENSKVLSATGKTIGDAFTNLNLMFGRSVKLGQVRFVMIGKKISQQNMGKLLDRLVRTSKIRNTVQLVYCPDKITDMFNVGTQLKSATGIKLSEIVCHQQNDSTTSIKSNIDSFYKGYYSPSGISKLNTISISSDYTQGISASSDTGNSNGASGEENSGGESAEGGTSGSQDNVSKKFISNKGKIAIYKDGVLKSVLNEDLSNGINWLSNDYNPKDLLVEVKGSNTISDASVNFDILNKKVNIETFFYKNIPFLATQIILSLDIDEIISNKEQIKLNYDIIDDKVKSSIGDTIRRQVSEASKYGKNTNLDLFELNDIFYQRNYNDYKKYLEEGKTEYSIIEDTQISVDVEVKIV